MLSPQVETGSINRGKGMLVICEECSKKYNIDESKIKGARACFSCQACGHSIVVVKSATLSSREEQLSREMSGGTKNTTP